MKRLAVSDHTLVTALGHGRDRVHAVVGSLDDVSRLRQLEVHDGAVLDVVLDEQHARSGRRIQPGELNRVWCPAAGRRADGDSIRISAGRCAPYHRPVGRQRSSSANQASAASGAVSARRTRSPSE